MFKALIFLSLASLGTFASTALPVREEPNFKACVAADPSWMSRWGQWVIGTDLYKSYDDCRKAAGPSSNVSAKQIGCYLNGSWVRVGYYCYKQ